MTALRRLTGALLAGVLGACLGLLAAYLAGLWQTPPRTTRLPYPHVVPPSDGGAALRFAMVHDVIHERLPRHGRAYYLERNRRARLALAKARPGPGAPPQPYFDLLDDLAVGLDMVGEHDKAVQLMRDKLREQTDLGLPRASLYSTHANLGTFLILGPFRNVRPGNEEDKRALREGLECIQTAIDINPDSHFGREAWQAAIIRYMIALYEGPELLLKFDMVGNRLDKDVDVTDRHPMSDFGTRPGGSGRQRWGDRYGGVALARRAAEYLKRPDSWADYKDVRKGVMQVGAEGDWDKVVPPGPRGAEDEGDRARPSKHNRRVPFDEPTLGIVGMWRLGGGAHPYFAVALGETMLRVGQRYLAWSAFERAARLAGASWPDPRLQKRFREHCRRRQGAIEATLPAGESEHLRPAFDAELALGLDYQKAYQRYEEERIAAGKSIEDAGFYADFHAGRPPIASPVGDADWFEVEDASLTNLGWWAPSWRVSAALLFGGGFALAAALWLSRAPTAPRGP